MSAFLLLVSLLIVSGQSINYAYRNVINSSLIISDMKYSFDQSLLVVLSNVNTTIQIYNGVTLAKSQSLSLKYIPTCLFVSQQLGYLYVGSNNGSIFVYGSKNGIFAQNPIYEGIADSNSSVMSLGVVKKGGSQDLAVGCKSGKLTIWNLKANTNDHLQIQPYKTIQFDGQITSIGWSPYSLNLYVGSNAPTNKTLSILNSSQSFSPIKSINSDTNILSITFSLDGQLIVMSEQSQFMKIWTSETNTLVDELSLVDSTFIYNTYISEDKQYIIGVGDSKVYIFSRNQSINTYELTQTIPISLNKVGISPSGGQLLMVNSNKSIVWYSLCGNKQFYNNHSCSACLGGCSSCKNNSVCELCSDQQHFVLVDAKCQCGPYRKISQNICQCIQGYYQQNGSCQKCLIGCLICKQINKCQQCDTNNNFQQDSNGCSCVSGFSLSNDVCSKNAFTKTILIIVIVGSALTVIVIVIVIVLKCRKKKNSRIKYEQEQDHKNIKIGSLLTEQQRQNDEYQNEQDQKNNL